jgi:hypothetical protein
VAGVAGVAGGACVIAAVESFMVESVLVALVELLLPELHENSISMIIAADDKNLDCFI